MLKKKLPVGLDNFEKIRKNDFYYVDKSGLIIDLLNNWNEVTLFTRPRRFGKTLNLSMLESFFSPLSDKCIFNNLKVMKETVLCEKYMGKHPVISVTLKNIEAEDFNTAYKMFSRTIRDAAAKVYMQINGDDKILPTQKNDLDVLLQPNINPSDLYFSLYTLSGILEQHYGQKVIILIDEYDVPLAKAHEYGYYEQMILLIRNIFHLAFKTNNSLLFAVLSGCMRISKESIFTGLNNLEVRSISDEEFDEYFGFTDAEVRDMFNYYDSAKYYDAAKEWYDGYSFGQASVYCPWDIIKYCKKLYTDSDKSPENFWINSSNNEAVRKLVRYSDTDEVKGEIEALLNGETLEKTIRPNLTYPEMYASIENIWSILYTTGYLTRKGTISGERVPLAIPNKEICNIFAKQILELFMEDVSRDGGAQKTFCDVLKDRNVPAIEKSLNDYLSRTISIKDPAVRNSLKENFYHGILLGILSYKSGWTVISNQEAGNGYSDIQIRDKKNNLAIVIEVKYAGKGTLEKTSRDGLKQIDDKHYTDRLRQDGFQTILKYGMAFYLKESKVAFQEEHL